MLPKKIYDHIIPLGQNCEAAFQMSLSYGQIESFPYNWAYITDNQKLLDSLANPSLVFSQKIQEDPRVNMWFDQASGISFHGSRKPSDFDMFEGEEALAEKKKELDELKSRTRHLFDKLQNVWASRKSQLYLLTLKEPNADAVKRYVSLLKKILESKTENFTICVVLERKTEFASLADEEHVLYRFVSHFSPTDCVTDTQKSDRSAWARILEEFAPRKFPPKTKKYKFEENDKPLNVKILVGYHRPSVLFKSDVLVPIHLGRACAQDASKDGVMSPQELAWMHQHMIGDDTGDNISALNRHYNEMTGIYWAWKNYDKLGDPDYIGFMHYRRLFSFTDEPLSPRDTLFELLNKTQLFNDELIRATVKEYDLLTPEMVLSIPKETTLKQKADAYPLKNVFSTIKNLFPRYADGIESFIGNDKVFYSNMFIMKKELFFEYCNFIFPVLREYEKQLDYKKDLPRRIGFDSEFVTALFLYVRSQKTRSKILSKAYYCDALINYQYQNVEEITRFEQGLCAAALQPAFGQNNVPVVLACDDNYAPYAAVMINSIIQNASAQNNYDIILLHTDISDENQRKIRSLQNARENLQIRLVNVKPLLAEIQKDFFVRDFYSVATYFRILIQHICANYPKALYMDTDMVVCRDVAELFATELGEYVLAAAPDLQVIYQANTGKKMPDRDLTYRDYFKDVLGMDDITRYFQAGVLVLDVTKMKALDVCRRFLDKAKEVKNPFYVDQDILNSVCRGMVKMLDGKWNHVFHAQHYEYFKGFIPAKYYQQYAVARQKPDVIHFTGERKPWTHTRLILADEFWKYAGGTPFFEQLLFKTLKNYQNSQMNLSNWTIDMDTVVYTARYARKTLRKWRLALAAALCRTKRKERFLRELENTKRKLQKAKNLMNKYKMLFTVPSEEEDYRLVCACGLFDARYYARVYGVKADDLAAHYCQTGWKKNYNPCAVFNGREYAALNGCKGNPLADYAARGKKLGHYTCITPAHQTAVCDVENYWAQEDKYPQRKTQTVYTCLTGGYDFLVSHKYADPRWSYVCFTDDAKLLQKAKHGIWRTKPLCFDKLDNIRNNRYHKILPYAVLGPQTLRSLYVDANCNILTSQIFDLIEKENKPLLIPAHFSTPCLYQEMEWYKRHYPLQRQMLEKQHDKIALDGFPANYGMTENNLIYRVHADEKIRAVMRQWWEFIERYVPRDQLSLSYVLWKNGIKIEDVCIPNARVDLKNYVFYPHQQRVKP